MSKKISFIAISFVLLLTAPSKLWAQSSTNIDLGNLPVDPPKLKPQAVPWMKSQKPAEKADVKPIEVQYQTTKLTVHFADSKNLESEAELWLDDLKDQARTNLCGARSNRFSQFNCSPAASSCDFSFQSERCKLVDSRAGCPRDGRQWNRRFGSGRLQKDYVFCVLNNSSGEPSSSGTATAY